MNAHKFRAQPTPPLASNELRPLRYIGKEIFREWQMVGKHGTRLMHPAWPYLKAMLQMNTCHDMHGLEHGDSIVLRFLSNATGWRGEAARRLKVELNRHVEAYNRETGQ